MTGCVVCTPIAAPEITMFTRRFCFRPSAVSLEATDQLSITNRCNVSRRYTVLDQESCTAFARFSLSFWLYASLPTESV